MWLSAANSSYEVDPAIPESQIPVTDKEGNEVSLIDFVPDPNMSPEDRAILVEKTEQILEDLMIEFGPLPGIDLPDPEPNEKRIKITVTVEEIV